MAEELTSIPTKAKRKKPSGYTKRRTERKATYAKIRAEETALVQQEQKALEGQVLRGRPTDYTPELAAKICNGIIDGKSLRSVCREEGMPSGASVFLWLSKYPEFSEQYTKATTERAEAFHEDILDIADDGSNDLMEVERGDYSMTVVNREAIERSKLRVETRKFLMSRMNPKKYGDKIDLTSDGKQLPAPLFGGLSVKPDEVAHEAS